MLWDSLVNYLNSKYQCVNVVMHIIMHVYFQSFVNDSGVSYNPRKIVSGPYGSTSIFTGPKVRFLAAHY